MGADGFVQAGGIDAGQHGADDGLAEQVALVGQRIAPGAQGLEEALGCTGGVFGDGGGVVVACGCFGQGVEGEDSGKRVAASLARARIGDRGESGEEIGGSMTLGGLVR